MVVNEIITEIAHDLWLRQFVNESELQFTNRVIYSAMSCWIKTSTFDRLLTDSYYLGASRKHVLEKCTRVLDELLKRCPQAINWFYVDGEDDPITIIRRRLLQSGELIQVGYDTNIGLAEKHQVDLGYGILQLIGSIYERPYIFSGIALVANSENKEISSDENITKWFGKFINNAWWKEGSCVDENTEFFNPEKKTPNNYSCWGLRRPQPFYSVILTRHALNNKAHEYIMEKEDHGIYYYHRLDPFLQETCEHRRMMFALRFLASNSARAYAKIYNDHIQLNINTYLPNKEIAILETFGWPCAHIAEKLCWYFPIVVWPLIKNMLENVGIAVEEEYYG